MAAHLDPWILCDVCGSSQYPVDAGEDSMIDKNFRAVRAGARLNGWEYRRGVGDVCPVCAGTAEAWG